MNDSFWSIKMSRYCPCLSGNWCADMCLYVCCGFCLHTCCFLSQTQVTNIQSNPPNTKQNVQPHNTTPISNSTQHTDLHNPIHQTAIPTCSTTKLHQNPSHPIPISPHRVPKPDRPIPKHLPTPKHKPPCPNTTHQIQKPDP